MAEVSSHTQHLRVCVRARVRARMCLNEGGQQSIREHLVNEDELLG